MILFSSHNSPSQAAKQEARMLVPGSDRMDQGTTNIFDTSWRTFLFEWYTCPNSPLYSCSAVSTMAAQTGGLFEDPVSLGDAIESVLLWVVSLATKGYHQPHRAGAAQHQHPHRLGQRLRRSQPGSIPQTSVFPTSLPLLGANLF